MSTRARSNLKVSNGKYFKIVLLITFSIKNNFDLFETFNTFDTSKSIFLSRIINLYFELKDGYLAQLQKSHMKRPPIKTYTIKDYRNFKKDAPTNTNSNTGKLGFDYDNEYYKQKV
jgi:hypothetical protein